MKRLKVYALALITSAVLVVPAATYGKDIRVTKPEKLGFSSERLQRVDTRMQAYIDNNQLAGISALVARNGKVAYFKHFGMQDKAAGQPVNEDTIFRIYSMTKPVTAVAALQLWEQGEFHMLDPISKYIPELQNLKVYVSGSGEDMVLEDQQSPITIKDLFLHTSGLSYGFHDNEVDKLYRQAELFSSEVDALPADLAKLPLQHQPGSAWTYGVNTDVLGLLVEKISGLRLGDYMQKHIFTPLKMDDTGFYVPSEKASRLAQMYTVDANTGKTIPMLNVPLGDYTSRPKFESGGGGLVSTMTDYLKFAQMLLDGGKYKGGYILAPRTVDYMRSNHLPNPLYPFEADSPGEGYGLAMSVVVEPDKSQFLTSKGNYGWGGLATTFFRIAPEDNMVIISMTQMIPYGFYPYQNDFRNLVHQAIVE